MGGNRIKEIRDRAGLTQKDLADYVGLSTRSLISLEQKEELVNKHLEKIAEYTGSSVVELIGYEIPDDVREETGKLREAYDQRHRDMVSSYEQQLKQLREKITLLENNLEAHMQTIRTQKELIKMLNSQLDKGNGGSNSAEQPPESAGMSPTEQEIS